MNDEYKRLSKRIRQLRTNNHELRYELEVFRNVSFFIGGVMDAITFFIICTDKLNYNYPSWWSEHGLLIMIFGLFLMLFPTLVSAIAYVVKNF